MNRHQQPSGVRRVAADPPSDSKHDLGLHCRPRRREGILTQEAAGTLALLSFDAGYYSALNEVGRRVWELCDGTRAAAEVITQIFNEYDAPLEIIQADVLELLRDLVSEQLLADNH